MKDRVEPNRTTTTTTTSSSSTSPGRRRGRRRHVVVVGAGLAGLVCAHTLLEESAAATETEQDNGPSQSQSRQQQQSPKEPAALHVTLVEASDRVGGRIAMDDDFCPGLPLDLGAEYITLVDSHHNHNHNNAKNDHDPSHSAAGGLDEEPLLTQYIQEFQAMGLLPTMHHSQNNQNNHHKMAHFHQPQNIPPVAVPPKPVAPSKEVVVGSSGDHASNASSDSSSSISLSFSQPPSSPLPTKQKQKQQQQQQPPSPPQAQGLLAATLAKPTSSLLSSSLGMKNHAREAASVNDDGSIVIFNVLDQSSNNNNNNKDGSKSSSKDPKTERPSLLTTLSSTSLGASRRTLTHPPPSSSSSHHHAQNLYSGTTTSIATSTSGSQVECSSSSMLDVERFPNHDSFHNSMDLNVHLNDSAAGSLLDPYFGHYVAEEDEEEEEEEEEDDEDTDKEATNPAPTTSRMDPTVYQQVFATAAATHCCSSNSSPGTTRSGHYGRYFCNGKLVSAHEASTVVPLTQTLDQLFFQPATTITTTTINAESPQDGSTHTASLDPNLSLEQAFGMAGTTSTLKTPMARQLLAHKKHVRATSSTASAASAQSTTKTGLAPSLYKLCLASLGNAVGCTDFSDLSFAMMRLQQQAQRHYDDNHEQNGSATGEWSMYRLAPPLTMYSVVEALLQLLTQHPRYKDRFTLRLNAPVTQIKTVPQPSLSSRSAGLCLKIQQQQPTDAQEMSLLHADHVVVAVPPTVLSRILPNILPSKKMEALNYIGYTNYCKVMLKLSRSFWPAELQSIVASDCLMFPELCFRSYHDTKVGKEQYLVVFSLSGEYADEFVANCQLPQDDAKGKDSSNTKNQGATSNGKSPGHDEPLHDRIAPGGWKYWDTKLCTDLCLQHLATVLSVREDDLRAEFVDVMIHDWESHSWIECGKLYPRVGMTVDHLEALAAPIVILDEKDAKNTTDSNAQTPESQGRGKSSIHFCGEATDQNANFTLQAAMETGHRAAHEVLEQMDTTEYDETLPESDKVAEPQSPSQKHVHLTLEDDGDEEEEDENAPIVVFVGDIDDTSQDEEDPPMVEHKPSPQHIMDDDRQEQQHHASAPEDDDDESEYEEVEVDDDDEYEEETIDETVIDHMEVVEEGDEEEDEEDDDETGNLPEGAKAGNKGHERNDHNEHDDKILNNDKEDEEKENESEADRAPQVTVVPDVTPPEEIKTPIEVSLKPAADEYNGLKPSEMYDFGDSDDECDPADNVDKNDERDHTQPMEHVYNTNHMESTSSSIGLDHPESYDNDSVNSDTRHGDNADGALNLDEDESGPEETDIPDISPEMVASLVHRQMDVSRTLSEQEEMAYTLVRALEKRHIEVTKALMAQEQTSLGMIQALQLLSESNQRYKRRLHEATQQAHSTQDMEALQEQVHSLAMIVDEKDTVISARDVTIQGLEQHVSRLKQDVEQLDDSLECRGTQLQSVQSELKIIKEIQQRATKRAQDSERELEQTKTDLREKDAQIQLLKQQLQYAMTLQSAGDHSHHKIYGSSKGIPRRRRSTGVSPARSQELKITKAAREERVKRMMHRLSDSSGGGVSYADGMMMPHEVQLTSSTPSTEGMDRNGSIGSLYPYQQKEFYKVRNAGNESVGSTTSSMTRSTIVSTTRDNTRPQQRPGNSVLPF